MDTCEAASFVQADGVLLFDVVHFDSLRLQQGLEKAVELKEGGGGDTVEESLRVVPFVGQLSCRCVEELRDLGATIKFSLRKLNVLEEAFGDKMEGIRRPEIEPVYSASVQDAWEVLEAGVEVWRECGHDKHKVEFFSDHPNEKIKELLTAAFRVKRLVQLAEQGPNVLQNLEKLSVFS